MPKKHPQRDPVAVYARNASAARTVGQRQCECGEARPWALIPKTDPPMCAECQRRSEGRSTNDEHHPAGRANDPTTTPIPVNDHRADLSIKQYDWPQETRENTAGNPLLARAACIRGYIDTNSYLVEKLLLQHAEFWEILNGFLTEKLGPDWWINKELKRFAPKKKTHSAAALNCRPCLPFIARHEVKEALHKPVAMSSRVVGFRHRDSN